VLVELALLVGAVSFGFGWLRSRPSVDVSLLTNARVWEGASAALEGHLDWFDYLPRLQARVDEVALVLEERHLLPQGPHSEAIPASTLAVHEQSLPAFVVQARAFSAPLAEMIAYSPTRTGDAAFDTTFIAEGAAVAWLDPVRRGLLRGLGDVRVRVQAARLEVCWRTTCYSPAGLVVFAQIASALVRGAAPLQARWEAAVVALGARPVEAFVCELVDAGGTATIVADATFSATEVRLARPGGEVVERLVPFATDVEAWRAALARLRACAAPAAPYRG
jgi:hypothetical protein